MDASLFTACFAAYIAAMVAFGWWVTRRHRSTGSDFLLGGRSLPLLLTLGTTLATMVGTGSSMGAVGKAYRNGWMGSLYGLGGALGILAAAWLFAPARRERFMTMAEELASYVGASRAVANLVGVFTYLSSVGWLGAHILGGSRYLEFVTGINPLWAQLAIALGFAIYATIGGYRAVVWTDTVQAIVLFTGFLLTAGYAFHAVGGWAGLTRIDAEIAAAAVQGGGGMSALPALSLVVVIAVGVLGTPSFRQRIYSGNSVRAVRRAFATSGVLFLGFALLPAIIGMAAFDVRPGLRDSDLAFPTMATEMLPLALGVLVLLAGLSATMSSASSDAVAGVATLMRDLYRVAFGRVPDPARVVGLSRCALAITTALALGMAMAAKDIVAYIADIIALFITGMCVCGVLGRLWGRFNAPGAIATLVAASATSLVCKAIPGAAESLGNPVLPSLAVSSLAGVAVSLATAPDALSRAQALEKLRREREEMEGPAAAPSRNP